MSGEFHSCRWTFQFQCPQKWSSLAEGDDPNVRVCGVCLENVYLCNSDLEVALHAELGHCVAILPPESNFSDDECFTIGALAPNDAEE